MADHVASILPDRGRNRVRAIFQPRSLWALMLLAAAASAISLTLLSGTAHAAPDPCAAAPLEADRVVCTGDQPAGIANGTDFNSPALPAPFTTLDIFDTSEIRPALGVRGVLFGRTQAGDVTVNIAMGRNLVSWILTAGHTAHGIHAPSCAAFWTS